MGGFHFYIKNRNIALFEIKIVWNVRQPIVQTISTNLYLIMDVVCEYFLRFSIYDLGSCSLFNYFISCKNIKSLFQPLMIQFKIIAKIFLLYTFSNNHVHKWLITWKMYKKIIQIYHLSPPFPYSQLSSIFQHTIYIYILTRLRVFQKLPNSLGKIIEFK